MSAAWRLLARSATLAATTWLLIQPPVGPGGAVETGAWVGSWTLLGRYATQQACDRQRATSSAAILYGVGTNQDPGSLRARVIATSMRCIDASVLAPATASPAP